MQIKEGLSPQESALAYAAYFSSQEFENAYRYDGELGVILDEKTTTFQLWAPTASRVKLNLFARGNGGEAEEVFDLIKGERGVWKYVANTRLDGKYYTYSVTTALGEQEAVDPYARSAGVNGQRGMIIDLNTTNPKGWKRTPFVNPKIKNDTDAVIWEVHVRDFSNQIARSKYRGKFLAFTEDGLKNEAGFPVGIDYLVDLGITHVHLLPAFDYETVDESFNEGYNWGYDPQNYNVPEGSYSTNPYHGEVRVKEFKRMVQALHEKGISVVLDVVYNHTYRFNSNLNKVVPYYYYRYDNNGAPSNGSGCGNETASERVMVRKYIVDSIKYWLTEYNVDGFRFDLMGVHDVQTMREIEQTVHALNPQAILYGEGWTGGGSALAGEMQSTLVNLKKINEKEKIKGVAFFNDVIRDGLKGSAFHGTDTGFATGARGDFLEKILFAVNGSVEDVVFSGYQNRWNAYYPTNVINYVSAHDNLTLWDKICTVYGEGEDTLSMRLRRNRLASAIVFTALGIPFMQAGEELLRSKKNLDGSYNGDSYNAIDEVNNLKWNFTALSPEYQTSRYYKGLIAFRRVCSTLRLPVSEQGEQKVCERDRQTQGTLVAFTMTNHDTGEKLFLVYNAGEEDAQVTLPQGVWDMYLNGETASDTPIQRGMSGTFTARKVSAFGFRLAQ